MHWGWWVVSVAAAQEHGQERSVGGKTNPRAGQPAPTEGPQFPVESWFSGALRLFLPLGPPLSFRLTQALSHGSTHPPSAGYLGPLSLLAPASGNRGSFQGRDGLVEAVSLRFQLGQNPVQCQGWLLSIAASDS